MSTSRSEIRQQVLAQIITTMEQAIADGRDPMEVAEATYPGTPDIVLCRALANAEDRQTEAWWRMIERTIDPGIVHAAIADAACMPVPAGSRDTHLDEAFAALTSGAGGEHG